MTNISHEKAVMVDFTLKLAPPSIRESLLSNQSFREEYGYRTEAIVSFNNGDVSVRRSVLFNAIRTVFIGESSSELADTEGRVWNLTIDRQEDKFPNLILSFQQQRLVLPDFSVLSRDTATRIRFLDESASEVNLPLSATAKWRSIMEERALEDDEIEIFQADIRDTPTHVGQAIRSEIMAGESSISSLVPNSRRYFERLVGVYDGSSSIQDYAAGVGREFLGQLVEWQSYEGFLLSLLISSHSALTAEINTDHLDQESLEKAFDYVEKHGDMLSRLGAFEVGLRILPVRSEVEPFLLRLVHRIQNDDVRGKGSEFKLFSSLFVLVDGELARTRLLTETPPFYRRLASLAQAALIHRQLTQCEIDYDYFSEWAYSNRGEHFYMQSLADMRTEPRWNPDLADAPQIQAEFFGRIIIAGNNFQINFGNEDLRDIILGDKEHSLIKRYGSLRPYFPGPLEGIEESPNALPYDLAGIIKEQLDSDDVTATSFIALVNSAMIFRITSDHAELAAKALKLGNYTLVNLENKSHLMSILSGLATVSAVSRNPALAEELHILIRRYRRDSQYAFSIEEAMRLYLVASAARKDIIEWREVVGAWLTELAFSEFEEKEGEVFHSHLSVLLHLVPELWVSCARADAALQAWCSR